MRIRLLLGLVRAQLSRRCSRWALRLVASLPLVCAVGDCGGPGRGRGQNDEDDEHSGGEQAMSINALALYEWEVRSFPWGRKLHIARVSRRRPQRDERFRRLATST